MIRPWLIAATLVAASGLTGCTTTVHWEGKTPIVIEGMAPPRIKKLAPRATRVIVSEKKIEITEKIQFDLNKATILPESFSLLDEISQVIKEHPEITKLAIEGHASSDGPDQQNLALSDGRSKAVMAYIVAKGVDPKRLIAEGFGEKKPIADNNTEEGRIKNRRVEFNILERDRSVSDMTKKAQ